MSPDRADDDPAPGVGDGRIKANTDSMLSHTAESPYFGRTRADMWFDSERAAEAAGFTPWDRRDRNAGGSADPADDGSGPPGYEIKGNADSMLYHTPASEFYDVTKAEVWFSSESAARAAGFRNFKD